VRKLGERHVEDLSREPPPPRPAGVRATLQVLGTVLGLALLPYLAPPLAGFRAWVPGDPLPFGGLLRLVGLEAPAVAAATHSEAGYRPETDSQLLLLPAVEPPMSTPPATAGSGQATAPPAGPASPLPPASPPSAGQVPAPVSPAELEGITQRVEHPPGGGLHTFHQQLAAASQGRPGTLARLLVYGASTLGNDGITSALRHRLQRRFGDGGKGFVPIAPAWPTQSHQDVRWERTGDPWLAQAVTHRGRSDGRYGLAGVIATSQGHSRATFGTLEEGPLGRSLSRFELWYQEWPRGGEVEVLVDGGSPRRFSTRADVVADRVFSLTLDEGPHQLQVHAALGRSLLYGAVLETAGPGVVVDTAMLIGARANRLLNFDPAHWAGQIARRNPDLLVLLMGDNEIESDTRPPIAEFQRQFEEVIGRLRAGRPEASCLILSATDHGVRVRGKIVTAPAVKETVTAQRAAAFAQGCSFFDLYAAMGGEGSMGRWFQATPRLGWGDLVHFTGKGSEVLGALIYKALLADYAHWLEQGR